jgi:hypothetical protein
VGTPETQSTGTPPRRPTSSSGVPSGAITARRTTEGWLRSETSRALSAASRSARDSGLPASRVRRAIEEDAARNVRFACMSASVCSSARARLAVSPAKVRAASSAALRRASAMSQMPATLSAATAAIATAVSQRARRDGRP